MREIMTVTGPLWPEELGFCQCHEHIAIRKEYLSQVNPALCMEEPQKNLEELKRYKKAGGVSLIDAQPVGCGRMTKTLKFLSKESGIRILASTGFHKLSFYPYDHWLYTASEESLEHIWVSELTEGMYADADRAFPARQCAVKAGILKTAYDTEELSARYQKLFRAAVKAARKTDRILMIHVEQNTNPVLLQQYLLELGMPAQDMIFCHMDRACKDLSMHTAILKNGSYLEFDTIGRFKYHSDEREIQIIGKLLAAGFGRQLLYSLDTTRERLKSYTPNGVGLDYILNVFNPALRKAGLSEAILRQFSVENPARALTGQG